MGECSWERSLIPHGQYGRTFLGYDTGGSADYWWTGVGACGLGGVDIWFNVVLAQDEKISLT